MPSEPWWMAMVHHWLDSLRVHRFHVAQVRRARELSAGRGVLFVLWHQSLLTVVGCHAALRLTAMVSRSGDGTLLSAFLARRGIRTARGSRSRGGAAASLELLRVLGHGDHAVSAIDGPRGPFKQPQAGIIDLARRAGCPIVPVACRANRELVIKGAWDRLRVPLPRSHVAVGYGEPLLLPPEEPDAAEHERRRRLIAARLHALEAEMSWRAGRGDDGLRPHDADWMAVSPLAAPAVDRSCMHG